VPTPDVDVDSILRTLERHHVEYVVIGGFAAELHDVAVPPTRDVDLTPSSAPDNLRRLVRALNDLDARPRVQDGPPEGVKLPGGVSVEWLAQMVTLTLVTNAGPLDISMLPDGTSGYDDLVTNRELIRYGDHVVPVAALEDVIRSKEAAGRAKDLIVIPALRAHLRRTQRG
jgi:hypothetical protein